MSIHQSFESSRLRAADSSPADSPLADLPTTPDTLLPPDVAWRELLQLGPEHDPFWQQVRRARLGLLRAYLPMNVSVVLIAVAVVLGSIAGDVRVPVLVLWLASQLLGVGSAVVEEWVRRARRRKHGGSRAESVHALLRLVVVGCGWGLLFFEALGHAAPEHALVVVTMALAGIGSLAYATASWPLGSLAMAGIVVVATVAGLFVHGWYETGLLLVVVLSFIVFVTRGNMMTAIAFLHRMHLQERLREQEQVVRLLLNEFEVNGREWLYEFDRYGRITFASRRLADVLQRPLEDVIGASWENILTDRESAQPLLDIVGNAQPYRDVLVRIDVAGEERWLSLSGTPKFGAEGRLMGYRGVGTDVTERQQAAQRIADLATFDSLTGLVNRRIVQTSVEDALRSGGGVLLLFVDLDRFKGVNDSIGHGAGDALLKEVGSRLREEVGQRGTVGRLGGDEFAIVLPGTDADGARALGEAVIQRLSEPFDLAGAVASIGASVGMAAGPEDGATVEALMRAADLALYDVKTKGRGSVRRFDRAMHERAEQRQALEMDLRGALKAGQMWLAYQPIIDALDEQVVGFEALMRWRHPVHGEISPATFIPIAEESGLIGRLGRWALDEACRTAAGWPPHIRLSVNLSPMQFEDPDLVEHVRRTLQRWRIEPERLELELTESLLLDDRPQTTAALSALMEMGTSFALDDFGTGYSSLGYLQKIAFSRIKIDRSFVQASLMDGGESTAIIQAIVALAERLGMETTAEGTETRAEFETMRRLGCAQVQGYLFGKPMPADEASRFLVRTQPLLVLDGDTGVRGLPSPMRSAASGQWPAAGAPPSPPHLPAPLSLPHD